MNVEAVAEIKKKKDCIKNNGLIWLFTHGTPLGMMYRIYSDICDLIFLIQDFPDEMNYLFTVMEKKYLEFFELILHNVQGIDIIVGIDDTSTTLISPDMFEQFNVELINKRVDLTHKYGKFYLHHSCGFIKDLLPVYRKTQMDGVHAFTTPPLGDVWFSKGRELLGHQTAIFANIVTLDFKPEDKNLRDKVKARFEDAKKAGGIAFYASTPDCSYNVDFMRKIFETARQYQNE